MGDIIKYSFLFLIVIGRVCLGQDTSTDLGASLPVLDFDPSDHYDIETPLIATFGTVTDTGGTVKFGGVMTGINIVTEQSTSLSYAFGYNLLMDPSSLNINRQAIMVRGLWHLVGGPRYLRSKFNIGTKTVHSAASFAASAKFSYQSFSARSADQETKKIIGNVFNVYVGLDYSYNTGPKESYGVKINGNFLSLPVSSEDLRSQLVEVGLYYRFLM